MFWWTSRGSSPSHYRALVTLRNPADLAHPGDGRARLRATTSDPVAPLPDDSRDLLRHPPVAGEIANDGSTLVWGGPRPWTQVYGRRPRGMSPSEEHSGRLLETLPEPGATALTASMRSSARRTIGERLRTTVKNLKRHHHRLAIGVTGLALILAALSAVMSAAPAVAAPAARSEPCVRAGFFPTSINGITFNYSDLLLTRTFTEKGVTNSWHPDPAARIAPGRFDDWCVNAQFGSAMKVEYKAPDGTRILFEADQYVLSSPHSRCEVSGPSAVLLICTTSITKLDFDDSRAVFNVFGKGDVGTAPLPTVSCALLRDPGRTGDVVTGELCRGVAIGFRGTARLEGRDRDDGQVKSYACVEVEVSQVRDTQSSFLVARGTRCRIP